MKRRLDQLEERILLEENEEDLNKQCQNSLKSNQNNNVLQDSDQNVTTCQANDSELRKRKIVTILGVKPKITQLQEQLSQNQIQQNQKPEEPVQQMPKSFILAQPLPVMPQNNDKDKKVQLPSSFVTTSGADIQNHMHKKPSIGPGLADAIKTMQNGSTIPILNQEPIQNIGAESAGFFNNPFIQMNQKTPQQHINPFFRQDCQEKQLSIPPNLPNQNQLAHQSPYFVDIFKQQNQQFVDIFKQPSNATNINIFSMPPMQGASHSLFPSKQSNDKREGDSQEEGEDEGDNSNELYKEEEDNAGEDNQKKVVSYSYQNEFETIIQQKVNKLKVGASDAFELGAVSIERGVKETSDDEHVLVYRNEAKRIIYQGTVFRGISNVGLMSKPNHSLQVIVFRRNEECGELAKQDKNSLTFNQLYQKDVVKILFNSQEACQEVFSKLTTLIEKCNQKTVQQSSKQ